MPLKCEISLLIRGRAQVNDSTYYIRHVMPLKCEISRLIRGRAQDNDGTYYI